MAKLTLGVKKNFSLLSLRCSLAAAVDGFGCLKSKTSKGKKNNVSYDRIVVLLKEGGPSSLRTISYIISLLSDAGAAVTVLVRICCCCFNGKRKRDVVENGRV